MIAVANAQQLVSQRLTELMGRVYGALDFWTLACTGGFMPDFPAFVEEQVGRMRDCLRDVQTQMEEEFQREPQRSLLWRIAAGLDRLQQTFLELASYRTLPAANVQTSVGELQHLCAMELPRMIIELGNVVGTPVSDRTGWEPERQRYYQGILDNLPTLFGVEGCDAASRKTNG